MWILSIDMGRRRLYDRGMVSKNTFLDYPRLLNLALLGVVKSALKSAANAGLTAENFFYISFRTSHPGVNVPEFLKKQHPDTLTIILQHEFSNLSVGEREFGVSLSFDNKPAHIIVPFSSLVAFSDPSANFSLSFTPYDDDALIPDERQGELSIKDGDSNIIPISNFFKKTLDFEPEPA